MKACAIQMNIRWCDVTANLRHAGRLIRAHKGEGIDVFVLPEMFSTGFVTDPRNIEPQEDHIYRWMLRLSREMDALIVGSCITADAFINGKPAGKYLNRLLMVAEDYCVFYDKRHLFAYGGETEWYGPGDTQVYSLWRGVRFAPSVCFDLRFPAWLRAVPLPGNFDAERIVHHGAEQDALGFRYDCLINVANWPVRRQLAWDTLLRARAIENQAYVIGSNRVGEDPTCTYRGGTAIINPYGETIAAVPDDTEGAAIAEIDLAHLRHFREKFPVRSNADLA